MECKLESDVKILERELGVVHAKVKTLYWMGVVSIILGFAKLGMDICTLQNGVHNVG